MLRLLTHEFMIAGAPSFPDVGLSFRRQAMSTAPLCKLRQTRQQGAFDFVVLKGPVNCHWK